LTVNKIVYADLMISELLGTLFLWAIKPVIFNEFSTPPKENLG